MLTFEPVLKEAAFLLKREGRHRAGVCVLQTVVAAT
jgi:hypothetical protein